MMRGYTHKMRGIYSYDERAVLIIRDLYEEGIHSYDERDVLGHNMREYIISNKVYLVRV